jgi:hypothetical protein
MDLVNQILAWTHAHPTESIIIMFIFIVVASLAPMTPTNKTFKNK